MQRTMSDEARAVIPDRAALMRMATGYLARYAASSHRLRQVLERRIARRCRMNSLDAPDSALMAEALDPILGKLRDLGLLDDQAFAASRSRALQRKGLPDRRIRQALRHEKLETDVLDHEENLVDDAVQARRFVARKRIGHHRAGDPAPYRDKDLRSLMRAGFSYGVAKTALDEDSETES